MYSVSTTKSSKKTQYPLAEIVYNYDDCYKSIATTMAIRGWHTAVGIVESFPAQIGPSVDKWVGWVKEDSGLNNGG